MSFNIRYNNPNDGENSWPNRDQNVRSMVQFNKVDLLGLQEVLKNQLDDLVRLLPEYDHFGVGRRDGKEGGEYSPIFFKNEKFKLLDGGTYWLSETPNVPSKGWDAALNRIVTWVKLLDKSNNMVFYHFNTHFDHQGIVARKESAKLLVKLIFQTAGKSPASLTGDFNFTSKDEPYDVLTKSGAIEDGIVLFDAGVVSEVPHHGPTGTWTGFESAGTPGEKIDFIFVKNNFRVLRHGVLSDTFDGKFPSDHMPVLTEIVIIN